MPLIADHIAFLRGLAPDPSLGPLLNAALEGNESAVQARRATATAAELRTALVLACAGGHTALVPVLCGAVKDPNGVVEALGVTALQAAAACERGATIKALVDQRASTLRVNVDALSADGYGALHFAVLSSKPDAVKALLDLGADVNLPSAAGETPLIVACSAEQTTIAAIEALVQSGANVHATDVMGNTAAHVAARVGWRGALSCLIAHRTNLNAYNRRGLTPLHLAAAAGQGKTVKLLIASVDPDQPTRFGQRTALILACRRNHLGVVDMLIVKGSKGLADKDRRTPLQHAVECDAVAVVKALLGRSKGQHKSDARALLVAAMRGNHTTFSALRNYGISLKTVTNGISPWHAACMGGNMSIVRFFSDMSEFDMGQATVEGRRQHSALHTAAFHNRPTLSKNLMKDINGFCLHDKQGYHALHAAAAGNAVEAIRAMCSLADFENHGCMRAADHMLPVLVAAKKGNVEAVRALLEESHFNMDYDRFGRGLMHHAAMSGSVPVFSYLLSPYRSDPPKFNLADLTMRTPLDIAIEHGHVKLVQILMEDKFRFAQSDQFGISLQAAVRSRNPEIMAMVAGKARRFAAEALKEALVGQQREAALWVLASVGGQLPKSGDNFVAIARQTRMNSLAPLLRQPSTVGVARAAIRFGMTRLVDYLINHTDASLRAADLVRFAAQHGRFEILHALLRKNMFLLYPGVTNLDVVLARGHVRAASMLLRRLPGQFRCDFRIGVEAGSSVMLEWALFRGGTMVCPRKPNSFAPPNSTESTGPLHLACARGDLAAVRVALLFKSVDVDLADCEGETPLHKAAAAGHARICRALLRAGASPNKACVRGLLPIQAARRRPHTEVVALLEPVTARAPYWAVRPSVHMQLRALCKTGEGVVLRAISERPKGLFEVDEETGRTEMHEAAIAGASRAVVDALLTAAPMAIGVRDNYGRTPLHYARSVDMVEMLHKADESLVKSIDCNGKTALHMAVARMQQDVCRSLVQKWTCFDVQDHTGSTVLHCVLRRQQPAFAELLVRLLLTLTNQSGQDVWRIADCDGNTLLHVAATTGCFPGIFGCFPGICGVTSLKDFLLVNKHGLTPLMLAIKHRQAAMANSIVQNLKGSGLEGQVLQKADPKKGMTAVHFLQEVTSAERRKHRADWNGVQNTLRLFQKEAKTKKLSSLSGIRW